MTSTTTSIFSNPIAGKKSSSSNHGVADEARHYAQTNWAARLRRASFPVRIGLLFTCAFSVGFAVESFACRTGLYKTVVHNKAERRLALDEQVLEFRENMRKWQEEDMKIAADKAGREQMMLAGKK